MTFRHFLDASYALLVEGYLSVGANRIDLVSAVEKVEAGFRSDQPQRADVKSHNDQALGQLQAMMAGVQR